MMSLHVGIICWHYSDKKLAVDSYSKIEKLASNLVILPGHIL